MNGCLHKNIRRLKNANRKDAESVKIRRRQLRGMRKDINDKNKKQEESVLVTDFSTLFLFYSAEFVKDIDSSINTTEATQKS